MVALGVTGMVLWAILGGTGGLWVILGVMGRALDRIGLGLWAMLEVMGRVWAILGLIGRY